MTERGQPWRGAPGQAPPAAAEAARVTLMHYRTGTPHTDEHCEECMLDWHLLGGCAYVVHRDAQPQAQTA